MVKKEEIEISQVQWLDIPFDAEHPIAFGINVYPRKTQCHYDIHVGLEIGIVLEGKSKRLYGDYSYTAQPGQIWFAGLWEPHGFEVIKPPAKHMVIEVTPEFLDIPEPFSSFDWLRMFEAPAELRPIAQSKKDRNFTLHIAERLLKVVRSNKENWIIRTRLILQEFLLYFTEKIDVKKLPQRRVGLSPFALRQKLLPALILLEKKRCQNVTVAEASRSAHVSRSSFSQMFKAAMGISFGKYCQQRRLAGAIYDLRTTDLKLSAIAHKWGFCDAAHFVRLFKSVMRMTPNEYRQYWADPKRRKQLLKALPVPKLENIPMRQE